MCLKHIIKVFSAPTHHKVTQIDLMKSYKCRLFYVFIYNNPGQLYTLYNTIVSLAIVLKKGSVVPLYSITQKVQM